MSQPVRVALEGADPVARGSLRQQVTTRVLTAVFQGRFPSGERLVVQALADLYGVSPTPVREALVEVAGLGIVDLLPNRGAVVRPFGVRQVSEISQVRRLLEAEAARCACGRIDRAELDPLHAELLRLDRLPRDDRGHRVARAADTRLHQLIADSCGSARLAAEIGRYLTLVRALRDVSHARDADTNYRRTNDVPEHLEIVAPLLAGDAAAAGAAMDRHVRRAAASLVEVMFPSEAADARGA